MGCNGIWKLQTQTKELTKANFHINLSNLCIRLLSYKGDLVYDPFIESGTTAKSAIINNRRYIGSEIPTNYCRTANNQINNLRESLKQSTL